MTSIPQNLQDHQKQRNTEKRSQGKGLEKDMKTEYNVVSWMESWDRERTLDNG